MSTRAALSLCWGSPDKFGRCLTYVLAALGEELGIRRADPGLYTGDGGTRTALSRLSAPDIGAGGRPAARGLPRPSAARPEPRARTLPTPYSRYYNLYPDGKL